MCPKKNLSWLIIIEAWHNYLSKINVDNNFIALSWGSMHNHPQIILLFASIYEKYDTFMIFKRSLFFRSFNPLTWINFLILTH